MKTLFRNKWFRIGLGFMVTALLFILGHHEAGIAGGATIANAPVSITDDPELSEVDKKVLEAISKQMKQSVEDARKGLMTAEEFKVQMQQFTKALKENELKELETILEKQGIILNKLQDNGGSENKAVSVRDQIKNFIEANKESWDRFKRGESKSFGIKLDNTGNSIAAIEVSKAAATMTVAANTSYSTVPQYEPGLVDVARNQPFIEDYADTSTTSSPRIVWTEKTTPEGNALFLAEGGVKPLVDFNIVTKESYAKKVADKIKVSTEMLDDIDFIAAEIEKELMYQVDIKVDAELLGGAGDGTSSATTLKGLKTYAGGYVLTTIKTPTPNNFDAIRAAVAQIVSLNFNPTHVFINPIDGANMDLIKDSTGRPIAMEYKNANGTTSRLTVVETNEMAVGGVLVGDMSKFKVRNYKSFAISYGWVNDDFEKNLVTILGERRLHCWVADNNTGAFVDDTFANIKTALTPA